MSFGTYVKGIDGLMAGATSAWLYDVNDKSAEVGADSYKLKSRCCCLSLCFRLEQYEPGNIERNVR